MKLDRSRDIWAPSPNITERKQAEQMKSDFVSFATHQLRTPLAGIKWLLELAAEEGEVPPETLSYIQDARESADRLIKLVNDLLDISRLERGKLTITPQEIHWARSHKVSWKRWVR